MAINKKHIDTLEFQSNQYFKAFCRALETRNEKDGHWMKTLHEGLEYAIESSCNIPHHFLKLERSYKTAKFFDRYILQYALGGVHYHNLNLGDRHKRIIRPPTSPEVPLKDLINGSPYDMVQIAAGNLSNSNGWEEILKAMKYVREHYKVPKI